jgi:outer membrane protein OmpA-like peptidoglycan-associated protein
MRLILFLFIFLLCGFKLSSQESLVVGKPKNMGSQINSPCYDYRPRISPDGKILFFTRILCPNNDENFLFYTEKNSNGEWSEAKKFPYELNNGENPIYVYSISPDNNKLLITIMIGGKRKLCTIEKTQNGWSKPIPIELGINLPNTDATFFLNDGGNVLLFTYKGNDAISERDLYVSFNRDGKWSFPKHTGKVINNGSRILSPFLASDGITLYYASIRNDGFGSWDIYMTKRLNDTYTQWSEPVNLGKEINDSGHNEGFVIDALGEYAYFNANHNSFGGNDIYVVKLKEKIKPNPVALVKGKVINAKNNELLGSVVIYEYLDDGKEAGRALSLPNIGEYQITLPAGKKYAILAESKGFYAVNENLDLTNITESQTIQKDIYLLPLEVGQNIRLNNIFFERGKYAIKPESIHELNRLVKLLKDNPEIKIEIAGHTNNLGPAEANRILSENRANEVKKYLVSQRISPDRIRIIGYGSSRPIGDNSTEEGRALNQRVEFMIYQK